MNTLNAVRDQSVFQNFKDDGCLEISGPLSLPRCAGALTGQG